MFANVLLNFSPTKILSFMINVATYIIELVFVLFLLHVLGSKFCFHLIATGLAVNFSLNYEKFILKVLNMAV